ncbi:T-box protein H15-like [Anopheles nili]|uniref:T-box protein H15-like n=1 Tax=Anopheles nili TaxID=185578 RepID=UPI00237C0006|nr:T-box protein H15-like [Anopheles nili]
MSEGGLKLAGKIERHKRKRAPASELVKGSSRAGRRGGSTGGGGSSQATHAPASPGSVREQASRRTATRMLLDTAGPAKGAPPKGRGSPTVKGGTAAGMAAATAAAAAAAAAAALSAAKGATDFSIAAIMALREGSSGSPLEAVFVSGSQNSSVERLSEADDEVDVDVEECSDSEEPKSSDSGRVTHSRTTETPNSVSVSDEERLSPEPAQKRPTIVGSCNSDDLRPVQCHLETKELWDKFNELGTEMIITKTGRRMFPTVRVSFSGPLRQVTPADRYVVLLDVVPVDNRRYRYAYHRSAWLVAGKADPPPPARLYAHPDTPLGADALRKQVISFEKVKLTNNEMDKNGQIVLNSMHRYQPRIHLARLGPGQNIPITPKELSDVDHKTYVFPETIFTAVTAYQNQLITKLKIDSNPFAKGFRDSSRLTDFDRDPMDALLLEQHLRSPLRLFADPLMAQFTSGPGQDLQDAQSAALIEQARQHLQMWGRSPYNELLLPQMYQRPQNLGALNLGVWQNSPNWPTGPSGLPAGFLPAMAAAAAAGGSRHTPPPPLGTPPAPIVLSPTAPLTPTSSSGSPSPDPRAKHFTGRFAPYQIPPSHMPPTHTIATATSRSAPPSSPRSPSN